MAFSRFCQFLARRLFGDDAKSTLIQRRLACVYWCLVRKASLLFFLTVWGLFEPVVFLLMFCQADDKTAKKIHKTYLGSIIS